MSGQKSRTARRRRRRRGSAQRQAGQRPQTGPPSRPVAETPTEDLTPPAPPPAPAPADPAPPPAPAPADPAPPALLLPDLPDEPGFLARSRLRRRLRYLRHLREIQLRDIGGFVLELRRHGRERPDLLQAKVAWAEQTDAELRALERALDVPHALREIREPGIGGACLNCGAVHGSQDHFCATCGEPLSGDGADDAEGSPRP